MSWTIADQLRIRQENLECYDEYIAYLTEQKYKAYQEMREYDLRLQKEKALREQCLEELERTKTLTCPIYQIA